MDGTEPDVTGIICPCSMNNKDVTMVVDSGSWITCLSISGAKFLDLDVILKEPKNYISRLETIMFVTRPATSLSQELW